MPYTPPAPQSPIASQSANPSRNSSLLSHDSQRCENGTESQGLRDCSRHSSRSRAYMSKHRRSPSITTTPVPITKSSTSDATPSEKRLSDDEEQEKSALSSDTPLNVECESWSKSSSPSASPPTSSDEENPTRRGRSREITKLAELQAAASIIGQHRAGSPQNQAPVDTKAARIALGLSGPRIDISRTNGISQPGMSPRLPLSTGARKISHSRSTTDASAFFDFPKNKLDSPTQSGSQSDDEDIEDDELRIKPALIRKKSGELVRPVLRPSSTKRRPSSMPGTPTYSKAVHFQDNSLEHVRHFLQVDRPIAVSAGSSPVEPYDDEPEFPFGGDDLGSRSPPFDWEIRLTNFPCDSPERQALPVRMEKVYLSADTKVLIGSVMVRNLAFHKVVVARFTLDYWKTTSEVMAEYSNDVRKEQRDDGCDRFSFNVKLEDQANLESKTMFFCVKYHVNGHDFWDNNKRLNYQVDFSKKHMPQNGKQGTTVKKPLNAHPRNKPSATFSPRPRSMPSFDDFANLSAPYEFTSFPQPSAIVGDSPIRFKTKPSGKELIPDAPGKSKSLANQQAFGNRYDFGASLSAAIQAAAPKEDASSVSTRTERDAHLPTKTRPSPDIGKMVNASDSSQPSLKEPPKPAALTSEKPALSSSSYHELLDKYCFFGSGKPTTPPSKSIAAQSSDAVHASSGPEQVNEGKAVLASAPPRRTSPPSIGESRTPSITSPRTSRPASPATGSPMGSRTVSPTFGYPYPQSMQTGLFDTHTRTAIRG